VGSGFIYNKAALFRDTIKWILCCINAGKYSLENQNDYTVTYIVVVGEKNKQTNDCLLCTLRGGGILNVGNSNQNFENPFHSSIRYIRALQVEFHIEIFHLLCTARTLKYSARDGLML